MLYLGKEFDIVNFGVTGVPTAIQSVETAPKSIRCNNDSIVGVGKGVETAHEPFREEMH